ncbi:FAD-binding oxidoreductase [Flavihumibacter sp. CACIAM 22H1]|uniref:FAD-binding oxidoreductase n=1 Tax=Flavihumibacter sp. CACIAM 22H1 TaxID=1812911 RepID=UPI0007A84BE6|nr:FAD-binding oxidoreductase [Flavihumibacter sp. CACIAM 22H1]KYP13140.1 MAG: FAD-binding protein [Flavihumibacter sp. CACIAM 22H1]
MRIRKMFLLIAVLFFMAVSIPVYHLSKTKFLEKEPVTAIVDGYTDDASQLNRTLVDTIIPAASDKPALQIQLGNLLKYAKEKGLKISIAGARHSMGGHTISPNGIVVNMLPYNEMALDTNTNILTIGSGALWEDALHYLDRYQRSVFIMQAFSSFSVGGSLSVNGHGWQKELPPIAASVISFTMMLENGRILTCSRTENAELFKVALGGYGLFGIILDVQLKVVANTALQFHSVRINPANYVEKFKDSISANPRVELVYGRLRISKKHFLEDATLNWFEKVDKEIPSLSEGKNTEAQRLVFRGTVNSEYGKRLRWDLESGMNNLAKHLVLSRNEVLNTSVSIVDNKDSTSTDLLQEYFIPERNFSEFINGIKPVLLATKLDLLNITIRGVEKDADSFMNYAREPVFGFVFLFNQKKNRQQEEEMKALTSQLVEVALNCEGTFYLPYRLHLSKEQMRRSYPQADAFFRLKLKYDSTALFSNKFYEYYK